MTKWPVICILIFFSSCSFLNKRPVKKFSSFKKTYTLSDKSGDFIVERVTGFQKGKARYFTKYQVYREENGEKKIFEKSIVVSSTGVLDKKIPTLRPSISQYQVWFDKKKYFVESKIDLDNKGMLVRMESPESQWNKTELIKFPKGNGVFCYFSQVMECAQFTGFIQKAIENKGGKMNFHLLFGSFPYFSEQYLNTPKGLFASAILSYDGSNKNNEKRFSLTLRDTKLLYFINEKAQLVKLFWPSQGLSMIEVIGTK